jgi:predicted DNA-binding protein (MmcQ/YjbR family)
MDATRATSPSGTDLSIMPSTSRARPTASRKRRATAPAPLARLRNLCLGLPESHEVEAWGEPTFRVRNKLFAMYAAANNHHGGGRPAVWCKAGPGNQALMVQAAPARFFVPPYVGPSGWVGVWLDGAVDWPELADLLRDSYRLVAPKRLHPMLGED